MFYCLSDGRINPDTRLLSAKAFREADSLSGGGIARMLAGSPIRSERSAADEGGRKRLGRSH